MDGSSNMQEVNESKNPNQWSQSIQFDKKPTCDHSENLFRNHPAANSDNNQNFSQWSKSNDLRLSDNDQTNHQREALHNLSNGNFTANRLRTLMT